LLLRVGSVASAFFLSGVVDLDSLVVASCKPMLELDEGLWLRKQAEKGEGEGEHCSAAERCMQQGATHHQRKGSAGRRGWGDDLFDDLSLGADDLLLLGGRCSGRILKAD